MRNKRILVTVLILGFVLLCFFIAQSLFINDGKLHIVFCDVGQGDGIYIRTPKGQDILIDAGPDESILDCLSNHTPFWDREIELAVITHPHSDHVAGFLDVFSRYKVNMIVDSGVDSETDVYNEFKNIILSAQIPKKTLKSGERFRIDGVSFDVLWPKDTVVRTFTKGDDLNQTSLVLHMRYQNFDTLLTGDAESQSLQQIYLSDIEVLKVPHHGSRVGLTSHIVGVLQPEVSVISVGQKNKYGHPTKEMLSILQQVQTKVFRTDLDGEVEIISDGKSFFIR